MAGKRRQFSREFNEEAVRLVAEAGRPLTVIARELGIRPEQLRCATIGPRGFMGAHRGFIPMLSAD